VKRATAAALALGLFGCAGIDLRKRADAIGAQVKSAREQNAETCAPRELATAEANLRFARLELDQGDPFRAKEHLNTAEPAAKTALDKAAECGKVTVLIRQKTPDQAPLKVALKDSDGDGVPDIDDLCPDAPGPKENHGCPVDPDRDGDGVPDNKDACPDVPGPAENAGCPWADRDHDGVPDKDDECPDQPGPVENKGCPLQAAVSPKSPLVVQKDALITQKDALIVVKKDRIELKQQLRFKPNRAVLLSESFPILKQLAQTLKENPSLQVRIEGHTDNVGKAAANLKLSQTRAEAVRDYLTEQGVPQKQLSAEGFGSKRPIASNASRTGRILNRRVEFRVVETK
jgi:outer membrane protein OmpA-like peptidoglycan-associated protein